MIVIKLKNLCVLLMIFCGVHIYLKAEFFEAKGFFELPTKEVEVALRVEDGDFSQEVSYFFFNEEAIQLNEAQDLYPRRMVSLHLPPGQYIVKWKTKQIIPGAEEPLILEHSKILQIDGSDPIVSVRVRGNNIFVN